MKVARVPTGEEPGHATSVWPILVAASATLLLVALTLRPLWGLVMVLPLVASALGWTRENMRHHSGRAHAAATASGGYPRVVAPPPETRRTSWWWGTLFLVVTEALLFLAALLSLTAHHVLHDPQAPARFRGLNTPLALAASVVLWSSGIAAWYAGRALRRGWMRRFHGALLVILALGALFLGYQAREYALAFRDGFTVASGPAGSIFYAVTGLHGLHVLAGLVVLALLLVHSLLGGIRADRRGPAEAALLYWHFVDAVWVVVYLVLYVKVL